MASPKSIPTQVSSTAGLHEIDISASTVKQKYFYITALLVADTLSIDGVAIGSPGPLSLSSPLKCRTFTTGANYQVAYFIQ